ncbi:MULTISPECIES: ArgE/DapE family deacylase [Acidianus]|uniref:Probable succinyl-diaminopimelate desuccinylase n=1 Tax=Candidatus Acidianus copahuensis TaxID=1160895 RepID=A0A031LRN1_9CREN|nr:MULTISPECIES: ArgE/DapE family deacylase [Acidianus]EZQ07079.1 succinyl-diaminopimelate desuccinylase [Candidatus Acidianus copahuensis]NON62616.1 ArgE/DapE family deacylase [Acidianus sp. RZ1]
MELKELTSKLIQFKTINPPGEELFDCAGFIRDYLTDNGFQARIQEFVKGWPTVISGKDGGIMLNGHFDVVPAGETTSWKVDPFRGLEIDGKIYGRGSTDMKGGLAVLMKTFVEISESLDYPVLFTAVPDEEIGGKSSLEISKIFSPKFVIIGEPTGHDKIMVGEKGILQFRISTKGKTAHASTPTFGENAINKLIDDLISLRSLERDVEPENALKEAMEGVKEVNENLYKDVKRVTVNVGTIKGGLKVNVVPDTAEAEIDIRVPPGLLTKSILEEAKKKIKGNLDLIDLAEPSFSQGEYVKKFMKEKVPLISTYATDGRHFRERGIETIAYGPGELNLLHSTNEYVYVSDLELAYKNLKSFFEVLK